VEWAGTPNGKTRVVTCVFQSAADGKDPTGEIRVDVQVTIEGQLGHWDNSETVLTACDVRPAR
jgi:hypothetical protein